MTRPLDPDALARLSPAPAVALVDGLTGAIDEAAAAAPATHRFLRFGWFAAALAAYGGAARTLTVIRDGRCIAALPFVSIGPAWAGLVQVPGCYWPFRGVPVAADAGIETHEAMLDALRRHVRGLRIGPVYDGDPAIMPMVAAARAQGWTVIDRFIADSYLLDIAAARSEGPWPRSSTLKKNRFHEKHLAGHGMPDWRFLTGDNWNDAAFDALADIEHRSWIDQRTDGRDAKFTADGHGRFWREAARDPAIAQLMWAALLTIDGRPMAFSFDLNLGAHKYAIANSYDPSVGKHSPGKLLYYRNLVRAIDDGIETVDWGAGDSGYKRVIGAAPGPAIRDWLFLRPGWPAHAGHLLAGLWRATGNRRAPAASGA